MLSGSGKCGCCGDTEEGAQPRSPMCPGQAAITGQSRVRMSRSQPRAGMGRGKGGRTPKQRPERRAACWAWAAAPCRAGGSVDSGPAHLHPPMRLARRRSTDGWHSQLVCRDRSLMGRLCPWQWPSLTALSAGTHLITSARRLHSHSFSKSHLMFLFHYLTELMGGLMYSGGLSHNHRI